MLIDITPQEMRSICAALDLLEEYMDLIDEDDHEHIALQNAKRSFTTKVMRLLDEHEQMRAAIMDHEEGTLEIDDNAIVSQSEGGCYVAAWVWVPDDGENTEDTETA